MITYRKFWERCADAGISKNKLKNYYKIGKGTVVTVFPDRGDRYFSTGLYEEGSCT